MIGFSIAPQTPTSGIACFYQDPLGPSFVAYDQSNIKVWLERFASTKVPLCTNDSHSVYLALSFLGEDFLRSLKLVDTRVFFNVYRNTLNVNVYDIGKENYKIDAEAELERIKRIWFIQGEKRWEHIPVPVIEVFLAKDAAVAQRIGRTILNPTVVLSIDQSNYIDFMRDFLVGISFLEQIGVIDKNFARVVPRYEFDRIVTGRIINTEPVCFQTMSFDKFCKSYVSRFGNDGVLVVADWSNADFRAAAGLAQEMIEGEKKDPYTLIGKLILDKSEITAEERDELKNTILAVMYGYEGREHADLFFKAYPKIAEFKKWVINEARLKRKLTTRYGKTRFFPAHDKFETKAFNTINQMTVADFCKKAIIETQRVFKERGLKSTPIPYVCYDSFGFDLYLSERDEAIKAIREALIDRTIPPAFRQFCEWEVKIKNCAGEVIE